MLNLSLLFGNPPQQSRTVQFRKNERIFSQGDRSDALFYVESGTVKLTVSSITGKEALIGFFPKGQIFGENCLVPEKASRFHNAIAVSDVRALKIDRSTLLREISTDWTKGYALLAWCLERNRHIQQDLVDQLLHSSEERLLRVLSLLGQYGPNDTSGLPPRLTQQDLANMIGLSRQRVNVLISHLKKSGWMDQQRNRKAQPQQGKSGRKNPQR